MMKGIAGWVAGAILAVGAVSGAAEARSLEDILSSGVLRVGTYPDQPPLSSLNDSGAFEGFDVDVAAHIAEVMQVTLEIVPLTVEQRVPFLTSGQIDISLGALTRTPARALLVDYTIPLHSEAVQVLTTSGFAIDDWKGLDSADITLAATRGTWTLDLVAAQLPQAQMLTVESPADAVRAVAQGRAAAIVDVLPTFMPFTEQYGEVEWSVMNANIYTAWCGIGLPKGEEGLRNFLNVVLYDMHTSGKTQELWAKWYGAPNPLPVPLDPVF
jgi:polar amino acid transport system substrate-binding protein